MSNSQQKSSSSGKPVGMPAPMDMRSFISVVSDTFQPLPTSPRRWWSGMRRSVKNTSLKPDWPFTCLIGRTSTPGLFMSKKNIVRPSCLTTLGSVRVRIMPKSL